MVTQQHWEDKILWDTPYTPGPAYTGAGNRKDNYKSIVLFILHHCCRGNLEGSGGFP